MAKLSLHLEQKLKLSQFQRLTIQLMQMHSQEITDFLQREVTENPLLDIRYPDVRERRSPAGEKPIDNLRQQEDSLETQLLKQLRLQRVPKTTLLAAGLVIQHLDEKGFFTADLDELGQDYQLSLREMEKGLALVQSFEPPGIAARSIQEALLIQARQKRQIPPGTLELLTAHYEKFLQGKWPQLQQELQVTAEGLQQIRNFLKKLSLQPARQAEAETEYVRPDIEIYWQNEDTLAFRFLEELPEVTFRDDLYQQYTREGDKKTRSYIQKAKRRFLDLQTALSYRRQSMEKVFTALIQVQKDYFSRGRLHPFLQKDLAAETGLSTATVSRICHQSYLLYQGKNYPVKFFFSRDYGEAAASYQEILQAIKQLIDSENPEHPYSDQEIAAYLAAQKLSLARRTVTKFRQKLNIPNSRLRRRLK